VTVRGDLPGTGDWPSLIRTSSESLSVRVIETLTGVGPAELAQALPGGRQPDGTASNVAANVTIADAGEIGKVISAVGSVTLQRADGTTIVVAVGTVVLQNDVVITGAGSEVAITFTR
jgi:hypothetical protein